MRQNTDGIMRSSGIETVSHIISSIKIKCQIRDKELAGNLGLSCPELNCIKQYLTIDKLSVKELASKLNITSGGVTRIVGSLEKKGYVVREMSPEDRRWIWVYLTTEGQNILTDIQRDCTEYFKEIFSGIDESQFGVILKGLENLNELWDSPKKYLRN